MSPHTLPRVRRQSCGQPTTSPLSLRVACLLCLIGAVLYPSIYTTPHARAAESATTERSHQGTLSAFERCQIKSLDGPAQRSAECATFRVPENPAAPEGRTIDLYVARIKSLSPNPASDPLVLVAGGPGGSTVDMYLGLSRAFSGVLDERDILLLDQRGTGRSQPLSCALEMMSSIEIEPTLDESRQAAQECLSQLDGDPRYYTTSVAVQDLEALRASAGYAKLNIYGVSYGTRVAQHYLRRYPAHTRTLIIDGVVPPSLALGPDIALNAQKTLDSIFLRCAADPACAQRFPNLASDFITLGDTLRSSPPDVHYADPITGEFANLTLRYGTMAVVTRLLSYAPETAAIIPLTLHQAASGNYSGLTSQAIGILKNLSSSLSYGMHNSVMCAEDAPHYQNLDKAALAQTYLGAEQVNAIEAICEIWPTGVADDDIKDPVTSDIPVLLLSGEFDPITPPEYAQRAQTGLSNSHHFVAPGQGHGVIARGCIPRVFAHFVAEADVTSTIDAEGNCIARQQAMPFFLNTMGPVPAASDSADSADTTPVQQPSTTGVLP